jgi:hypothetical protein
MSNTDQTETPVTDELSILKARADMLGINYHPNIGVEKLRDKVNAALRDAPAPDDAATSEEPGAESRNDKLIRLKAEAEKLIRIRLTCMNPMKKDWNGEIITVGNSGVGSMKKYIPFNNEEGWHVPNFIYLQLKDRQCQTFVTAKTQNGVTMRKSKMIKEFAIEVLPPLTKEELAELARRQAMSHAID